MKKIIIIFLILFFIQPAFSKPGTIVSYTIDAEKNAYLHNNKGIEYVSERQYYAAIQEFKIAISLNPKKQSTAVYFNNLGKVYMMIGYPQLAQDCFENSIKQYSLNFEYYKNLADCYKELGLIDKKLNFYKNEAKQKPMYNILVGLLEERQGNSKKAIITFDEFANSEPDLIITPAIKSYTKELVKSLEIKND